MMRLSIISILPLATVVGRSVGATSIRSYGLGNSTHSGVTTRHLRVDPEERAGGSKKVLEAVSQAIAAISTHRATASEHHISDETAQRGLLNELKKKMHLPELPRFNLLDPIIQSYLKSRLLAFIYEDPHRTWIFQSWKWQRNAINNQASAPNGLSASMPATVHAATTAAERVISDKTAEDILQILWNEFQQEKRAQDFDHKSAFQKLTLHSQFGLMRDFHNFVYKDEDRKRIFDEWLKWQERTGKEPTFAKDIRSPMSTMDHTATGTPQVIPDKSAERIVQTLWTGLNQQMHLPQLPSLDRLDPIIQSYLKSRMLAFVQADQDRTMLFNEWLKTWQHKASSNAAPALDTFSAFMSPTVHGTTAAAKVISDETAKFILLILWREFDGNHLHELYDQRVVDRLDSRILETTKRKFQKFVYEDENRKRIFEEWLKWHEHTSRKKTLAQATTGKKRKVMD